jgi:hypothetical protein
MQGHVSARADFEAIPGVHDTISAQIIEHDRVARVIIVREMVPNDPKRLCVEDTVLWMGHCDHS